MATRNPVSVETILTFDNRDAQSQWSEVWSTTHIPGMDNASGGDGLSGIQGRKKLRFGALILGTFLTMHCRVTASALTGGVFVFILFHILATVTLANPLRHFEVYLGQWSISGPGRAFRILPMFEGLGIAICINALVRAIICCTMAAICAIYVVYSVSDSKLPFSYCRDFDLRPYDPIQKDISLRMLRESRFSLVTAGTEEEEIHNEAVTVGIRDFAWRNASKLKSKRKRPILKHTTRKNYHHKIEICNESYTIGYPILYSTPAYNFFYVEVVLFREDYYFGHFNITLMIALIVVWICLWLLMIWERIAHKRLIFNNVQTWLIVIPWLWVVVLIITSTTHLLALPKLMRKTFRIGGKEILAGLADAFEVAVYIHSAGVGTELIHGKGLNHYATGHIDPHLNGENVWHSGLLLLMTGLHSSGAAICAIVDNIQPNNKNGYDMRESTLWIIPMYSKCILINGYSHAASVAIFSGLTFSYMAVAYVLLKTSLHIIFEYKVKLVFAEQVVVAGIILTCMGLSFLFATSGGVALLESVDALMTGISTPFVCILELVAILYVYRGRDFVSDMNIATEENACSSRIDTQWQIIPIITLVTLIIKLSVVFVAELPKMSLAYAAAALVAVVIAGPLRAARNAVVFWRARRHK
ncbi:uncharacterized protein LOC116769488 isoform X1 [Danaus plexippus]|uniref:uncharacterized protein LOC116769488 isoform X1 n=1 Tax=Danaus plexippus TaxID=13037 RepID=UPI002AB26AD8|nr:uncharacterized protein LOC116769488 isoform X1 [Danaus plexippus]